ncbi:hypothetical protein MuYL_0273 [Mucilaginibacter xinganensis]|uniref:Uncharacterized protein n=1 Tax=Mucilaginibacter xinganensis TaxID=1234841 RepID=A0A223NQV1_9SPHI|nr:hypothetical protein MuYL_0273 [Mucilaginibacter xinganensis]
MRPARNITGKNRGQIKTPAVYSRGFYSISFDYINSFCMGL